MNQHEQWDIVSGVGLTALGVAHARAIETARPDRLIEDPYAAAFVAAAAPALPPALRNHAWLSADGATHGPMMATASRYMGVRSRLLDERLGRAAADGVRQVVILAAGLDARGYRLSWPSDLHLYEIDQPKVLAFKNAVLLDMAAQPRCARTTVPVDLREDWPAHLLAAGFAPGVPTAWLAEGLLAYLPADAEQRLFEAISELSAPGSHLACEYHPDLAAMAKYAGFEQLRSSTGIMLDTLFNTEPRPHPGTWLTGAGWSVSEETAAAASARYHRDQEPAGPGAEGTWAGSIGDHVVFLTARRDG